MKGWPPDALYFLSAFMGQHTFQTFNDSSPKDRSLARILHNPIPNQLHALNARCAGVYFMVNEGDGLGRKNVNVRRVRAFFADFDGGPLPAQWPIEPSFIIETSPGRFHVYWLLVDDADYPLDNGLFNRMQEAIARVVKSQPNDCKSLARVMRMPGFVHWKKKPFISRIIHPSLGAPVLRYTVEEIERAFSVQTSQKNLSITAPMASQTTVQTNRQRAYASSVLVGECNNVRRALTGARNTTLNASAYRLGQLVGGGQLDESAVRAALHEAGRACGLPDAEIHRTIQNGLSVGITRPENLTHLADHTSFNEERRGKGLAQGEPSAGVRLLHLLEKLGAEVWHDEHRDLYMTVNVREHREHYRLDSESVQQYLQHLYYRHEQSLISGQALGDAVGLLRAKANFEGQKYVTALRVAHLNGCTYLDLGSDDWSIVEIGAGEWRIISSEDCPVRFIRSGNLLPIPVPIHGGTVEELAEFINVDFSGLVLCTAWLLGAVSGLPPYSLLALSGEQGTGKSSAASVLRRLIDPHKADRRRLSDGERDLFIAAHNNHVLVFDNASYLPPRFSDALCTLATGGGYAGRAPYKGAEELVFNVSRPVVLNGIPDLLARPDLADRALTVTLRPMKKGQRRAEREFWKDFDKARPKLLGALLTALAHGLLHLDDITVEDLPRMADFAKLVVASEDVLPWPKGTFVAEYAVMRSEITCAALEGNLIFKAIQNLIDDNGSWLGSTGALLVLLTHREFPDGRAQRTWPTSSRALGEELRRLAPALRSLGYVVESRGRGTGGAIRYYLARHSEGAPAGHNGGDVDETVPVPVDEELDC